MNLLPSERNMLLRLCERNIPQSSKLFTARSVRRLLEARYIVNGTAMIAGYKVSGWQITPKGREAATSVTLDGTFK